MFHSWNKSNSVVLAGASEERIRDLFNKAYRSAPSIVFIDEIDAIASKREDMQRGMERRIVTQLMTCMDEFHQNVQSSDADDMDDSQSSCAKKARHVLVIGATNMPDAVDPALRRPGRFDREILLDVPDENARRQILEKLTCKVRLDQFDLLRFAKATSGFVGADLKALVDEAGNLAMQRIFHERRDRYLKEERNNTHEDWLTDPLDEHKMRRLCITMDDFEVI